MPCAERIESERRRAEMEALEQLANAAAHENTGTVEEDDADNAMQDGQSGPHETETSDDEYSYQQVDLDGGDAFPDDEPAPVMDFSEDVAGVKDADEGYDFAADALRHGENSGNGTKIWKAASRLPATAFRPKERCCTRRKAESNVP